MGLRKNLLTQSPPRPPWAWRTFRYWLPWTYPRPSRDAAPQGVVWPLTRRLCAKCRNVGQGKKDYFAEDVSTFGPLRPSPTQAGILLRSWLENRSREGFGRMSKCGSWKKKWIRMVAWCLELDGRRDRDECAKPTVGLASNLAYGNVAVFSLVRF